MRGAPPGSPRSKQSTGGTPVPTQSKAKNFGKKSFGNKKLQKQRFAWTKFAGNKQGGKN